MDMFVDRCIDEMVNNKAIVERVDGQTLLRVLV